MFKKVYLDPENKTFAEVMGDGKSYAVPAFQRDYSWQEEQLNELWQDIEHMQESQTQHFMGYLVLKSNNNKEFQIIDGQQRITTITLLIAAILGRFHTLITKKIEVGNNEQRKDEIHKRYLGVFNVVTLSTSPKLSLNRNNKDHFRGIVDSPYEIPRKRGIIATNRKLNKAFEFFSKKIEQYSSEDLAKLVDALGDGLLFTTITVSDDLDAFLVFETLNARGVYLSAPDLLKNYLLSTLLSDKDPSLDEEFESLWGETLEQLGETDFTSFLRSYEGMFARLKHKKELFRFLKKQRIHSSNEVMPYIKDLSKHASVYAALQNPDDSFWKEYKDGKCLACVENLRVLKLFSIKTPLSLLMAMYEKFDPKYFNQAVEWLVIISIRYNVICQKLAKDQESTYNQLSISIMNGSLSALNQIKDELKTIYPSDNEFVSAFSIKTMPSRQSPKRIIYLLKAIETHVAQGDVPSSNLTLEHVLPNKPNDQWQEYFGRDTYNEAIDRLANFGLLSANKNRDLGQESFENKRQILQESGIQINKKIAEYKKWDIEALNECQSWLAKQAKTVWRIEGIGN